MVRTSVRSLRLLQELCGDVALNKVIFLTTMWKDVPASTGARREQEIRERYWKRMLQLGSRVARFEDSRESAWRVIEPLFSGGNMSLKLQEQLLSTRILAGTGAAAVVDEGVECRRDQGAASSWVSKLFRLFFRKKGPKKAATLEWHGSSVFTDGRSSNPRFWYQPNSSVIFSRQGAGAMAATRSQRSPNPEQVTRESKWKSPIPFPSTRAQDRSQVEIDVSP